MAPGRAVPMPEMRTAPTGQPSDRDLIRIGVTLAGLCAAQRLGVLWVHGPDLVALAEANPLIYMEHYLPRGWLEKSPIGSLLYLRQTPPIPNLVMGLVTKLFAWPGSASLTLVALAGLFSSLAAGLLGALGAGVSRSRGLGIALGLLFVADPDPLFIEHNLLGQQFYESLAMLLLLVAVFAFWRAARSGSRAALATCGTAVALLALTRASYSYVFPIFALALVALDLRLPTRLGGRGRIAAFALPILLLHGGWGLKQAIVFGAPSIATSAWTGGNMAAGLAEGGIDADVRRHLLRDPDGFPDFFVEWVRDEPWISEQFHHPGYQRHVPAAWLLEDQALGREITRAGFEAPNPTANRPSKIRLYTLYERLYFRWALAEPGAAIRHAIRGYEVFWLPVRYHARQFLGLFSCQWRVHVRTRPWSLGLDLARGELPEKNELTSGPSPSLARAPVRLPVSGGISLVGWMAQLYTLHLLAPLLFLGLLFGPGSRARDFTAEDGVLLLCFSLFAYSALIHNLVEYGENMRFRLSVLPLIYLMTAETLRRSLLLAIAFYSGRRRGPGGSRP